MKKTKFAIIPVIIVGILVALSRCDFDKITKKKADPICDNVNISAEACKNLKKMFKNKKFKIHLSLSDDKPWAIASVIVFLYR